jgi:hypothetical protein
MSDALEPFAIFTGLGLLFALPIWAYWSQKAKIEVEREKTKQLELQLNIKRAETVAEAKSESARR